jgi:RNA-directed DNA polymerase
MPGPEDKPFAIPKAMVWEAWRRVKANKGAPGVDGQDLEQFEADLGSNLYKVWNRMSSGSYFPPPVRAVEIPKPHGAGVRVLGVPTIADRVAQTVVAMHLEQRADHRFHPDSYGYRPGKSAHEALAACRQRCWKDDWVIDLDVQKFFDEVPWDLVLRAVQAVTDARWVQLYVERWLAAPLEHPDGVLEQRTKGTPQGSAVSPILTNLFMHYAFDSWMTRNLPDCRSSATPTTSSCTARRAARRSTCSQGSPRGCRRLGSGCTRTRRGSSTARTVGAGGSTSTPRSPSSGTPSGHGGARSKNGRNFTGFLPAISPEALKAKGAELRRMRIHRRTDLSLNGLARWLNPIVAGWINYYGRFYRTALDPLLKRVNAYLRRWAGRKYKRLRTDKRFGGWWTGLLTRQPGLFIHWRTIRTYYG